VNLSLYCPSCESGDVYEASNGLMHCKVCGDTWEVTP
jgi:ribosomal protein L37AE/L43A